MGRPRVVLVMRLSVGYYRGEVRTSSGFVCSAFGSN